MKEIRKDGVGADWQASDVFLWSCWREFPKLRVLNEFIKATLSQECTPLSHLYPWCRFAARTVTTLWGPIKAFQGVFMRWLLLIFISHSLPDPPLWIHSTDHFPQGEPWHRLRVLRPRGEEGCREGEGEREGAAGGGGVGDRQASTQREEQGARVRKSGIPSQ